MITNILNNKAAVIFMTAALFIITYSFYYF